MRISPFLQRRRMAPRAAFRGFTLIEAVISLAISSVILAAVYTTYVFANRTWQNQGQSLIAKQQARIVLRTMRRELREGQDFFIVEDDNGLRMSFYRPKVGVISYIWRKNGDSGEIWRQRYAERRVLARNISDLKFIQTPEAIEVVFTVANRPVLGKPDDLRMRTKVARRDKTGLLEQLKKEVLE